MQSFHTSPDIEQPCSNMQGIVYPDFLGSHLLDVHQRTVHLTDKVDNLQKSFNDLATHLIRDFHELRQKVLAEFEGAGMGLGSSILQRARAHGDARTRSVFDWPSDSPNGDDLAAALQAKELEIRQLRETMDVASRDRENEKAERLREKNEHEALYIDWVQKYTALEQRHKELVGHNQASQDTCKDMEKELEQVKTQQRALDLRLKNSEAGEQRLHTQNVVLRGMITKNGGLEGEQVDDTLVVTSFIHLRDQTQRIAFKLCSKKMDKFSCKNMEPQQQQFFEYWQRSSSQSQLRNRMRGVIFDFILSKILNRKLFGLDGFGESPGLERGLVEFESALTKLDPGHEAEIIEWRVRTLRCASWMEIDSTEPEKLAARIKNFMDPVWPQSPANQTTATTGDELFARLLQLCKDAFKFTMLLRSSKDLYRCELPSRGSRLTADSLVQDEEAFEGPDPLTDQDIAFAMSGALIKYPEQHPEKRLVLEQAHVVGFQKKERK